MRQMVRRFRDIPSTLLDLAIVSLAENRVSGDHRRIDAGAARSARAEILDTEHVFA